MRSLIAGFVGSDADLELDDEDEEDEAVRFQNSRSRNAHSDWIFSIVQVFAQQRSSALKSTLMVPEDVQNLVAWYEHRFGKKGARS